LKIAIVRRRCGFDMGGAESYCANVASGLKADGHRVVVVADESTVTTVPFRQAKITGRGSVLKNLTFFMESRKVTGALNADLVYGLSRVRDADFLRISDPLHSAWLQLGYTGNPLIRMLRRFSLRHSLLLWQERESIRSCKFLVTNSNFVKKQLGSIYMVKPEYCFTVYNGVDHDRFRPCSEKQRKQLRSSLGLPEGRFLLLFAGSDLRRKGLLCILQAVSQMKQDITIIIAGSERVADAEALCQRLGILDRVIWLGFRADMERLYQAADIFCLPTLYDPFANTVLESMACATPAITTRSNGASEAIAPACPDLVIGKAEPDALRQALEYFTSLTVDERTSLREAVLKRSRDFTWEGHCRQLEKLFEKYCTASKIPTGSGD